MAKAVEGAKENDQFKKGRWTEKEHAIFVEGLQKYGKDWKHIAKMLKTRTSIQIRTHAQKYFLKYPEDERKYSQVKQKRNINNNNNAPTSPKRGWSSRNNGWPSNNAQPSQQKSQPRTPRHKKTQRLKKTQSSPSVLTSEPATEYLQDESAAIPFLPHTSSIPEDFPVEPNRFPDTAEGATRWSFQRGRSASALVQPGRMEQVYGRPNGIPKLQGHGHGFHFNEEDHIGHLNHATDPMDTHRIVDSSSNSLGVPAHVLDDLNGFPLEENTDFLYL